MSTLWLDKWIHDAIGLSKGEKLTRAALESYQLAMLNKTLNKVCLKSSFYFNLYGKAKRLKALKDIEELPLTSADDLINSGEEMLCVPQYDVSRIVTLETSGTTGKPKRIYFTEADQRLTIDHFKYGMQYLTDVNGKVLILLPHERDGSVGNLLKIGVEELGARTTFDVMASEITSIVGMPTHLARLAKDTEKTGHLKNTLRNVLLTAEYVSEKNIKIIEDAWNCLPFEHYGMTEMGLGGAVSCDALEGYHPREHDLYFEIINPQTGEVLPDGEFGEVVFTTLTREAMPLIRYRTGDISRWLIEPCSCKSVLKRLDKVQDRVMKKGGKNVK